MSQDSLPDVDARAGRALGLLARTTDDLRRLPLPEGGELGDLLASAAAVVDRTLGWHRDGPGRVACVGRTRAGKSTLRFVLTGQAEDGIGRGGQRTTRDNIEYAWRGVVLVDTPGVGALEGEDDVFVAAGAAADADLVLWVVGSDGLQLATIQPVLAMLDRGVPLLVVVNHKETHDVADLEHLTDEQLFPERQARECRLRGVLQRDDVVVLHVQLDVARGGRRTGSELARRRSQVGELEQALLVAATSAVQERDAVRRRRVARASAVLRETSNDVQIRLQQRGSEFGARLEEAQGALTACRAIFEAERDRGWEQALRTAEGSLQSAERLACTEEHPGKAQDRLKQDLQALGTALIDGLQEAARVAVSRAVKLLPADVAEGPDFPDQQPSYYRVTVQLSGDPGTARAFAWGRTWLSIATAPLVFVPVAGWAVRGAVLAAPVVIGALGGQVGPQVDAERAKRLASVNDIDLPARDQIDELIAAARERAEHRYRRRVEEPLEAEVASIAALLAVLTRLEAELTDAAQAIA